MSIVKKKLKIKDMHCTSCAVLIESDLEELEGVKSAKTHYAKCECIVEFDDEVVDTEEITSTIKNAGYDATQEE